jgi:hypothetical protein
MFILKGFKSFVLKVRILKGLWACFSEVRILKKLVTRDMRLVGARKERADLDAEGAESAEAGQEEGKRSSREGKDRVEGAIVGRNIGNGSRILATCQLLLVCYFVVIRTAWADSNGGGGSCGKVRSWLGVDGVDTAVEMCG